MTGQNNLNPNKTNTRNCKTVFDDLLLFVNTEDNRMGAKSVVSCSTLNILKSLKLEFELSIDNLLRIPWNEAEPDSKTFSYVDPKMIPDMCFLTGTNRYLKASFSFTF